MRLSRLLLLSVFLLALLGACAAPRYLTVEQDAEMRESCESAGCVTVPLPIWQKIEQMLQSFVSV